MAVLQRLVALMHPSQGGRPATDGSARHNLLVTAVLTATIIPAAVFVVLAAGVLLRCTGGDWMEKLFLPFGAITEATAYAMSF